MFLEELGHVLLHSVIDTAKMLPFLFLAYLVIEFIESKKGGAIENVLAKGGRFGFVFGAVLGLIPQCGFSAMAANFYASRVITLGTMIAVFIATSDEAIPLMLAQPESYPSLLLLLGVKLLWAIIAAVLVDFLIAKALPKQLRGGWNGKVENVSCNEDDKGENIFLAALKHTANVYVYVLIFTFVFGLLVEFIGEAKISTFLASLGFFQPIVAGLFGLIPNCASSVMLTQLYLAKSISFGSVFAGLSANAGIGIAVLFKANKKQVKQNVFIVALLWALGVLPGIILHLLAV